MPVIPTQYDCIRAAPAHRVYIRASWLDDWQEYPYLYANWVYFGCGGNPNRAELEWRYGQGVQPGETRPDTYLPLDLIDWYVKVEIDQDGLDSGDTSPILWHGIVREIPEQPYGDRSGTAAYGLQRFIAYGLESLLERSYLTSSWAEQGDAETQIPRAIQFNTEHNFLDDTKTFDERKTQRWGNRSADYGSAAAYVFAETLKTAKFWTSYNIAEYLLAYYAPRNVDGSVVIPWEISDRAQESIPDWDSPVVHAEGKSVRQVLDEIFDRRRLVAWRVVVENDVPKLDAFTFTADFLELPSGYTYSPNEETISLDLGGMVDAEPTITTSAIHRVDRVICRGAKKRAVFTVSYVGDTLEADWKSADETDYESGPSGMEALDAGQKKIRIENWRKEDRFHRVYSYFRVPTDWDFTTVYDLNTYPIFPDDDETGPEVIYLPEARFERHLPAGVLLAAPDASQEEQLAPAAWIKLYRDTTVDPAVDRYQHIEKIQSNRGVPWAPGMAVIDFGCSLKMQDPGLGIIVKTSGGRFHSQEAIAKTDFSGVAGIDVVTPPLDWKEMYVTAMLELDSRVQAAWPPIDEMEDAGLDVARIQTIDMGDRYRADYSPPGTWTGVTDGVPQRLTEERWWRDDRDKLLDIARFCYEWYATERRACQITFRAITNLLDVGDLITTIQHRGEALEINSVVTGIHYDLMASRTTVTTAFAELDPARL